LKDQSEREIGRMTDPIDLGVLGDRDDEIIPASERPSWSPESSSRW
jgi:hypothetical protein